MVQRGEVYNTYTTRNRATRVTAESLRDASSDQASLWARLHLFYLQICTPRIRLRLPSRASPAAASSEADVLDMGAKFRRRALLWWPEGNPHSALIVKKRDDADASEMLQRIGTWLVPREDALSVHHPYFMQCSCTVEQAPHHDSPCRSENLQLFLLKLVHPVLIGHAGCSAVA